MLTTASATVAAHIGETTHWLTTSGAPNGTPLRGSHMQNHSRESSIQKGVIDLLKARGAWVVKIHQSGRGRRGVPDVIACYRGQHLAIEVKTPGGRLTALQIHELLEARKAGSYAIVARSKDDVAQALEHIDQCLGAPEYDLEYGLPNLDAPRRAQLL